MSNFRDKLVIRLAIITTLLMMTGVSVAGATQVEQITATWVADGIEVNACYLVNGTYQIRYYQSGTTEGEEPYDAINNQNGYYTSVPEFTIDPNTGDSCYTETFKTPPNGDQNDWRVDLVKARNAGNSDSYRMVASRRVNAPVDVPIPEFPTIALPIAGIIGIMFLFHSRYRKED